VLSRRWMVLVAALAVAAVACSEGDPAEDTARADDTTTDASRADTSDGAAAHDPPLVFSDESVEVTSVRDGVYAVHEGVMFYVEALPDSANHRLIALDLATGEDRWSLPMEDEFASSWGRPAVAEVDGQALVFATHAAVVEGTGTQVDQQMLRVVALDVADGTAAWTADIAAADIPEEARDWVLGDSPGLPVQPAGVVGATATPWSWPRTSTRSSQPPLTPPPGRRGGSTRGSAP
jgi:hypothetical protein